MPEVKENGTGLLSPKSASLSAACKLMLSGGLLSLFASVISLVDPRVYQEVVQSGTISRFLSFGSSVQDLITAPAALLLIVLTLKFSGQMKKPQDSQHSLSKGHIKTLMAMTGLGSYLFYGYGLYVIQGQYTSLYLVYLAIFSLTLYGVIAGIVALAQNKKVIVQIPHLLRRVISGFLMFILIILIPVWILRMQHDLYSRMPGEVYGVFVLDLGVVFPAIAYVIWQLIRKTNFGVMLAGVALIKALTLCLSVALGEILKPIYGFGQDVGMVLIFTLLTVVSGGLSLALFSRLEIEDNR
ncbi:hypothetical protein [Acidaminobacter hydrogenoformans]|uniref:Uncharacterized protein n=1 Tax=Acidaminobacter hydrogenoformans DSM 2784 TaxID=1120920 RepID=A0A1G5S8D7_9FIRM|nr:hypothetical protein [Acidaminobacter hydrogenoformans]SCZ81869.1 hypothetical protein SAMN03080599_03114 [Acidaminobacter hydrogenoformans DSM 2784]